MKWLSIIFIISIILYFNQKIEIENRTNNIPEIKIDEDISEFYNSTQFRDIADETKSLEDEINRLINPNKITDIPKIDFINFTFKPNTPINYISKLNNFKFYHKKIKKDIIINSNILNLKVNISSQRLKVYKNKKLLYNWKISSGKRGYSTPRGRYRPQLLEKIHYSKKYHNAPMPYSIFFRGGYAFHGTKATHRLGRIASHGCVRLRTSNAKKLFYLVKKIGKNNVLVDIY